MRRIGALVPAPNMVVEQEFNDFLYKSFDDVSRPILHIARIPFNTQYEADAPKFLREIAQNTYETIFQFKDIPLSSIGFFCTSAGSIVTPSMDKLGNASLVYSHEALADACNHLQLKNILLITPYSSHVGNKVGYYLRSQGIESAHEVHRDLSGSSEFLQMGYEIEGLISKYYNGEDGIIISCTNVPSMHAIKLLEDKYVVPALTSNQATIWKMLNKASIDNMKNTGFGMLFKERS